MKNICWSLFLVVLLGSPVLAEVVPLHSFAEVKEALTSGFPVRVVAHYGKCKLVSDGKEEKAPDAIGGMPVETFEFFARQSVRNPKAFLVFSTANLINYKGYIYNYGKFKIYEDNRVEITAQYAKPVTFRVIMDETFSSVINDGRNDGAVFFFCQR
jgi:hypothetical protein